MCHCTAQSCTDAPSLNEAMALGRVCVGVLETLGGFLDWANMDLVMQSPLPPLLCSMLGEGGLRASAADCLLIITSRKV